MLPPSRNQVTQLPNARPPTPHSSRLWMEVAGRRQRAARKPARVMTPSSTQKTPTSMSWLESFMSVPVLRRQVQEGHDDDRDQAGGHLIPVEERDAGELRVDAV